MSTSNQHVVLPTSDLIRAFGHCVGVAVGGADALELMYQIFAAMQSSKSKMLDLDSFLFTPHHLREENREEWDAFVVNAETYAAHMALDVIKRLEQVGLSYGNYLPYLMVGNDICLRRVQN